MKSLLQNIVRATLVAGITFAVTLSAVAQDQTPGIVRITKMRTTKADLQQAMPTSCDNGNCQYGGGCQYGCQYSSNPTAGWQAWADQKYMSHFGCYGYGGCYPYGNCNGCCGNGNCRGLVDYLHCKFGYFIPTGAGGAGVSFCGKYARVYPDDPRYFDQRDGQLWAAQGYGLPMAVPLAPVVGHTYNYGWGIPSSRLTPVSNPAY
jgi:hypothetical protein